MDTTYLNWIALAPWIYAIAHRTFIDEVRKQQKDIVRPVRDHDPEPSASLQGDPENNRSELVDSELVTAALSALALLSDEQRQAVVLTKLEGKTLAEAAEIAGTSVTAMKVRVHRGFKNLRSIMAHPGRSLDLATAGGPS